jgi:DNA-binding CsgD family transcriptional regulator
MGMDRQPRCVKSAVGRCRPSWRKACAAAANPGVTLHDLRGTAVTRLALSGCTEAEIATIIGHTPGGVRSILDALYLHRDPGLAESATRKLERRTRLPERPPKRSDCSSEKIEESAAKSVAGGLGFEPRLTESESAVLPLNYPPIVASVAQTPRDRFCPGARGRYRASPVPGPPLSFDREWGRVARAARRWPARRMAWCSPAGCARRARASAATRTLRLQAAERPSMVRKPPSFCDFGHSIACDDGNAMRRLERWHRRYSPGIFVFMIGVITPFT